MTSINSSSFIETSLLFSDILIKCLVLDKLCYGVLPLLLACFVRPTIGVTAIMSFLCHDPFSKIQINHAFTFEMMSNLVAISLLLVVYQPTLYIVLRRRITSLMIIIYLSRYETFLVCCSGRKNALNFRLVSCFLINFVIAHGAYEELTC